MAISPAKTAPVEIARPTNGQRVTATPTLKIVSMSLTVGDTICDDYIDVEWEKDTSSDAQVQLDCNSAYMLSVDTPVTVPDMLPSGVTTFHLTHSPGHAQPGVTVTATITQNTVPKSLAKTANVDCTMMMPAAGKAAAAAAPAPLPVALDGSIEKPIRLVRHKDKILLGTYCPNLGSTVTVAVQQVTGQPNDVVIAELRATVDKVNKKWYLNLPHCFWAGGCPPHLSLRLILRKQGVIKYAKTFGTLILCTPE
jgi:hypothetical protein